MRGRSKTPPAYRKHKPSGQAVVTLNGKDHYLGPHGTKTSQVEYDRIIGEWLANGRTLAPEEFNSITVVELCAAYWTFAKGYYVKDGKPTDELSGLKVALRHLRCLYGPNPVTGFGPLALAALQDRMIAEGNSRRYINQQIGRIRRAFKWGVARELVPVEIHAALTAVPGLRKGKTEAKEHPPVLPVADDVVDRTIKHMHNKTTKAMIRFQRLTGCRPGELFVLRPKDIDRSGGGHEGVWLYWPASHKMEHKDRHRVIVIGPKAQKIIAPFLLRDESEFCFLRPCGKPYRGYHYSQHINRACDKAFRSPKELDGEALKAWQRQNRWAPNRLRHSAATEIRKAHGLEAAQVVAGHSSADVTQIYAERDLEKAAEVMAQVG